MGRPQRNMSEPRRYVLADKFQPKGIHQVEATESVFGKETPAVRRDVHEAEIAPDADLQASVKAILAAIND